MGFVFNNKLMLQGSKSRQKILLISKKDLSTEEIIEKLKNEMK